MHHNEKLIIQFFKQPQIKQKFRNWSNFSREMQHLFRAGNYTISGNRH